MSLTSQVKKELARLDETLACCSSWELKALLLKNGYYTIRSKKHILSIAVDDIAVARRLFHMLRKAGVTAQTILRQQEKRLLKNQVLVQIQDSEQIDALLVYLDLKEAGAHFSLLRRYGALPKRTCCRKAFLRGAFLAGGSISVSRRSGYHLEINCGRPEDAPVYQKVLASFNLSPLLRVRDDSGYLYFKSAEAVADFLRIIGAGTALLELESQRVVKSMRNQVNRLVNCETANLGKVVASAQNQLEIIDRLDRHIGISRLSPALREAARLRRSYPEASLKELGQMLEPPASKSAMNHRFRQLESMAERFGGNCKQKPCQSDNFKAGFADDLSK